MTAKTKKIIDKVFSITWWGMFLALFAVITGIIVAKAQGKVPKLLGYSVIKITTASMGDTIPVGTYILIVDVEPEDVNKDDIICFQSEDERIYGYPNTHRVVEDPIKVGEKYEYVTKGDASLLADDVTAKSDKLIGKYVKTMKVVTWISNNATSKGTLVGLVGMILSTAGILITTFVIQAKKEQ